MKKVLLFIIDALSQRVLDPALEENRLPNLRSLRDASEYCGESISVFPSITPAATSSLITGRFPIEHGVSGAYWYLSDEKKVVYFGYDIWAALEEGIRTYAKDFLMELNEEYLRVDTLFKIASEHGLSTASLNFIIYEGNYPHKMRLPDPLDVARDAIMGLFMDDGEEATVHGPQLHYFGDLVQTSQDDGETLSSPGGSFMGHEPPRL